MIYKTFESFLNHKYAPVARSFDIETINLLETDIYKRIIKKGESNVTDEDIKELNKFLKDNKYKALKLYHGTSADIDIENEGLLKTKEGTKKSMQSETGYVYLSMFKDMAKTFGDIAYPRKNIIVYEVHVQIISLMPDKDQLRNKRAFGQTNTGDSLAESIIFGNGVRVKSDIPPYMIKDKFIYKR